MTPINQQDSLEMALNQWPPITAGNILSLTPVPSNIKAKLSEIPCEVSEREKPFLFNFFKMVWPARANVLEIGPLFGASTRAIALGMQAHPASSNKKLVTVDRFKSYFKSQAFIEKISPLVSKGILPLEFLNRPELQKEYPDFLDLFHAIHSQSDYYTRLDIRQQTLPDRPEHIGKLDLPPFDLSQNDRFDSVFIDGCKSWYGTKYFMKKVSEHAEPNCYYIFQDFGWYTCFWLPVFMALFSDVFSLVAFVDNTYIFQQRKPLSANAIEQGFPDKPEYISPDQYTAIFSEMIRFLGDISDVKGIVYATLQYAAAIAYCGDHERSKKIILDLAAQPYSQKYRRNIEAALKSPTYRPPEEKQGVSQPIFL